MADYCILAIDGLTFYATHGHVYNENNLPPFREGDILIHGHTHVQGRAEGWIYSSESGIFSVRMCICANSSNVTELTCPNLEQSARTYASLHILTEKIPEEYQECGNVLKVE